MRAAEAVGLPRAQRAALIRANQKDEYYAQQLSETLLSVSQDVLGASMVVRYKRELHLLSKLIYYGVPALLGRRQTLGEEYCDLYPCTAAGALASRRRVLLRLALAFAVPYVVGRVRWPPSAALLGAGGAEVLGILAPSADALLAWAQDLHKAVFYIKGCYSSASHRLARLSYRLAAAAASTATAPGALTPPTFDYAVLGVLVLVRCLSIASLRLRNVARHVIAPRVAPAQAGLAAAPLLPLPARPVPTCSICLEPRRHPTLTRCGHVFCWTCIAECCLTKPECPVCRTPHRPSELVPIYNSV